MGLFRSEDIHLLKVAMTKDTAYESMRAFGRLESVSFIDLNVNEQVYDLPFSSEVKRCNETLRRIENIMSECRRLRVVMKAPATINEYYMAKNGFSQIMQVAEHKMFDKIEKEVQEYDDFLTSQTKSLRDINHNYQHLKDYQEALKTAYELLEKLPMNKGKWSFLNRSNMLEKVSERDNEESKDFSRKNVGEVEDDKFQIKIGHMIGTISTEEKFSFKRLIFRSTRGNALIQFKDIKPKKNKESHQLRSSFVLTFQEGASVREKLERITKNFGARIYDYPEHDFNKVIQDLDQKIFDTKKLLRDSNRELRNYLVTLNDLESKKSLGGNSPFYGISTLPLYKMFVQIEEEIYRNMNCLKDVEGGNLKYGFAWSMERAYVVEEDLHRKGFYIRELQLEDVLGHHFETPTYFKTNAFTEQFHQIVDTYGTPRYKEVNPTLFTIISFPFLFGVMFGDVGHGGLLFIVSILLCLFGKDIEALKPVYSTRYLLLLMGFFSVFCGLMYNDFMSVPLELSNSCFRNRGEIAIPVKDCVYPFGIDPKWYTASNELTFMNSFKMKLAVILGVAQMLLGISLRFFNSVDFCDYVEFIAQFTLMTCWFGYMNLLIIGKWLTFYSDTSIAPSIIASMIDMFLKFGAVEKEPIISDHDGLERIQIVLLIVSFLCIPAMLLVRPLIVIVTGDYVDKPSEVKTEIEMSNQIGKKKQGYFEFENEDEMKEEFKKESVNSAAILQNQPETPHNVDENSEILEGQTVKELKEDLQKQEKMTSLKKVLKEENHGHSLEELFVHQLIETIEFVLGTVSNTASYLRLWALSLAHSQLADVFFEKTLVMGLEMNSPVVLFISQQLFWAATLGVLMSMDSMECFLHTLRLHWVEFQSKFYKGTGSRFVPLSFSRIAIGDN